MYRAMDGPPVRSVPLKSGDRGTRQTADVMQRLATEGSRDPVVRDVVIQAIRSAGVGDHNLVGQAQAWFAYVRDRIYFLRDPIDTEWLQSARVTIQSGAGDCDDRAILIAAGLRAFGVPARFKIVAVDPRQPGTFSHVYVEANLLGRWVAMDPTYSRNTLGSEPSTRFRTWMVPA